jgi:hypothetical protein
MIILLSSVQSDDTIDAQIEQIMSAKSSERYELMNQLKTKIATMKVNERNEALQKLSDSKNINGNHQGSGFMQQMHQPPMSKQPMNSSSPMQHQMNHNNSQNKR